MSQEARSAAEQQLRDPGQVMSLSAAAMPWDPRLVEAEATGPFWELLEERRMTLLVTREYEHLVLALSCVGGVPTTSVLRVPHPSGLVVDRAGEVVHVACTRNPNQVMQLRPVDGMLRRGDRTGVRPGPGDLAPAQTRFLPGSTYLHDLAIVGGRLVGNAVGINAVVDLDREAPHAVWWPESIEVDGDPDLSRNVMQLNSVAAGASLERSFFTASTEGPTARLPGDPEWEVDRLGVVLSGKSRGVVARGLTRPHSARLAPDGRVWLADSGYGTLNVVDAPTTTPVARLDGWTRGLCLLEDVALVGTSRVIPRFAGYAPGLDVGGSRCGVHVVRLGSGAVEASLIWPRGDQIFAIDWIPSDVSTGFLGGAPGANADSIDSAWYGYSPAGARLGPLMEQGEHGWQT